MDDRRPIRSFLSAGLAAVLVVACGSASPASPTTPASAAPASAPTAATPAASMLPSRSTGPAALLGQMLLLGRPGQPELHAIDAGSNEDVMTLPFGAPDPDWARIVTVNPRAGRTEVRQVDISSGATGPALDVAGEWRLPTVGSDPLPVGRSANGSTVVLVPAADAAYGTGSTSRFLVLDEGPQLRLEVRRTIQLTGAFEFDALSPDGSILYVVQHLDSGPGGRYQVRSIQLPTGTMDDTPITDKRFPSEPMAGVPITQIRAANGWVMTLYRGPEHPFIHLLSSAEKWAVCIDLPATGAADRAAAGDWGLVETSDGRGILAANESLGLVADVDLDQLTVRRTGRITGSTAAASGGQTAQPAIVLAKFGHDSGGSIGSRAVVTPDGAMLVAGGRDGLAGIATKDLATTWQALPGAAVRSLAMSPDGQIAFALLSTGKVTAVSVKDGSVIGDVGSGGYDRLLGVAG